MKLTKNSHYSVYLRSLHQWVPVSEEQFHAYYRGIDTFRRKQQRHGRCACPKSGRLLCDMDCATCPYQTEGDTLSLDRTYQTDAGTMYTLSDLIADRSPLPEERMEMKQLFSRLCELVPEAVVIGELRLAGKSDATIAREIGINRKTFLYRLKRAKEILKKEFPGLL